MRIYNRPCIIHGYLLSGFGPFLFLLLKLSVCLRQSKPNIWKIKRSREDEVSAGKTLDLLLLVVSNGVL